MKVKEAFTSLNQEFQHLSQQDIEKIQAFSLARHYKKGQVLFNPGDERTHLFLLTSGTMKFEKIDSTGTFFYLHFLKSECLFPRIGLFSDSTYSYSAIAHTDIDIVAIPVKIFEDVLKNHPKQLIHWIEKQSELLQVDMVKIQKGMTNSAFQRVATTLAILFKDLGEPDAFYGTVTIQCPITINDISKASGTTRETTSSIIKKLVKSKKITYNHKCFTFLDIEFFKTILTD